MVTIESDLILMAGPCAVESYDQIMRIAEAVKKYGAQYLRGGAYKPRTMGGDWEGLKETGLELLLNAKREFELKVVTEILRAEDIKLFLDNEVDLFQIGARNTQNQELLNALGAADVPCLLKNGMNITVKEWLGAASRLPADKTILCARGKNNETDIARNGVDMVTLAYMVDNVPYKLIFDPSHSCGRRDLVYTTSVGAVAMGVDGLIVEVHDDPFIAITDGKQSITPKQFNTLVERVRKARNDYLENRKYHQRFLSIQIPSHVDIYFLLEQLPTVRGVLGDYNYGPYKSTDTGIMTARIPSGKVSMPQLKKIFARGELLDLKAEPEGAPSPIVNITTVDNGKVHISPYSEEVLKLTGRKVSESYQGYTRAEFAHGYPQDPIRDAFLTIRLGRVPSFKDPLVLYRILY